MAHRATHVAPDRTFQAEEDPHKEASQTPPEVPKQEYVLEVIQLGVTADKHRQLKLWEALQSGSSLSSIREQDPQKYPWDDKDKMGISGGRIASTLENGAGYSVSEWGVPVFNAGSPRCAEDADSSLDPAVGMVGGAELSGMISYAFVAADRMHSERPDRLLEKVFDFFDANPDIPYVFLTADDGIASRSFCEPDKRPLELRVGYYVPKRTDASAMFILARRERAEPLRRFAYVDIDDYELGIERINRDGIARRLLLNLWKLQKRVPRLKPDSFERMVTVDEWLDFAKTLSVRADFRGDGKNPHMPSKDWKPTPWFPIPWSKSQLQDFDNMLTLGFLHRPIYVKTTDQHNRPLKAHARRVALMAGIDEALNTLPEAEREKGPARVIAATNNRTEQLVALESVLHDYAARGGPRIDSGKLDQFINMDRRLGDTGAATWFTQMAIGVMGSYQAGGASMAINLRDPHEASIVFITPPPAEKRKAQQQREPFRNIQHPTIDPSNYAEPAH
jgi:hypothetical protein